MFAFPRRSAQYALQLSFIQFIYLMKTQHYNPSPLEQELARAIAALKFELNQHMSSEIVTIESMLDRDNPKLNFILKDSDGDEHKLVVQVIQQIDD